MTYSLFLDDEREPPADGQAWHVARSSTAAIAIVSENGVPAFISFDHDLGGDDTAMRFIHWLTGWILDTNTTFPPGFDFYVHSQNPIGRGNIQSLMASFQASLSST